MRTEIRLAGFGGQGIALAGFILGKALTLHDGYESVMTQSYGPEARGGASSTNLVVADRPIDYPFIQQADILVVLSQEAYTRFREDAKPEATIILDEDLVSPNPDDKHYAVPATQLAEDLGRRIVANVVMLGAFASITGFVKPESMNKSIETSVKERFVPLNVQAFELGYEYGRQLEPIG
jgi:2-oxoglutarate ferredoxin oxidoreductase subunit gamma